MKHLYTLSFLIIAFLTTANEAFANKYKTISSGNYSDTAIWQNRRVPPITILSTDEVEITSGTTVNLDKDVFVTGTGAKFYVNGTLVSTTHGLGIHTASFGGSGKVDIDSFYFGGGSIGLGDTLKARIFVSGTMHNTSTNIYVKEALFIGNGLTNISSGGILTLADSGFIQIYSAKNITPPIPEAPRLIKTGTGIINLPATYDLVYRGNNISTGLELEGIGLRNTNIYVCRDCFVEQSSNFVVNGKLTMTKGALSLNGYDLIFAKEGNHVNYDTLPKILASKESSIVFKSNVSTDSALLFKRGKDTLKSIRIESPNRKAELRIARNVNIDSTLYLSSGRLNTYAKLRLLDSATTNIDSNGYVITSFSPLYLQYGALVMNATSTIYPVGTRNHFTPFQVNTGSITDTLKELAVSLAKAPLANIPMNAPRVEATWVVQSKNPFPSTGLEVKPIWHISWEKSGFDRAKSLVAFQKSNAPVKWDLPLATNATQEGNGYFSQKRSDITESRTIYVFDIHTIVSVKELSIQQGITLYPNPATNVVNISYNDNDEIHATLINLAGKQIQNIRLTKGVNKIDVSQLNAGIYFIKLTNRSTSATHKIIKQ